MNHRSKNILNFILVLSGLLVATLYSPFGSQSPDEYTSLNNISVNPGVQFNGDIANAPSSNQSRGNYSVDLLSNVEQLDINIIPKYSASGSLGSDNNFGFVRQISSGVNVSKKSNVNSSAPGDMSMAYGYRNSGSNSQTQSYGFTAISSDLITPATTNPTTKQSAGNTVSVADVSDPGGNPLEPIIPVGDGWAFLIFLAGTYAVIKRFVLK